MKIRIWGLSILIAALALSAWIVLQDKTNNWFTKQPLPMTEIDRFFDVGVVDANGDGNLDIYTSNHHFRQLLLIGDGNGDYRDVLSEWGLDQSRAFPHAELSFIAPKFDKPGLYIYWFGTQFIIKANKTDSIGNFKGTLHVYDPVKIMKNDGFSVTNNREILSNDSVWSVSETTLDFAAQHSEAYLRLRPGGQGLPIDFHFEGALRPDQIFVGLGKVSPDSLKFSLAMRDRHAMVWADYNGDGKKDIFINRGALGGRLRAYPEGVRQAIKDELLIRKTDGLFEDVSSRIGIEKSDCSGRHARWLDFNNDDLLDLYVNCYDRSRSSGNFPKQLYVQQEDRTLVNVAEETGASMPDQQIGSFSWIDVDNDGDVDLVTLQNEGFFLYRNNGEYVTPENIYEKSLPGVQIGDTAEGAWVYDGRLTTADYDRDGDIDLFASSKRGNVLLINEAGEYTHIRPSSIGLPEASLNASWVDYDNDGLIDIHTVPQGLFQQNKEHHFEATDMLRLPNKQFQAAVTNWFDLDNNGYQDMLIALNVNPDFQQWWSSTPKPRLPTTWLIDAYRNIGSTNHWLQIKLVGTSGNREAIGARVMVFTPDGQQTQEVGSNEGSFFSQGHYRLYFGLGKYAKANLIKIRWPDGSLQELKDVSGDTLLVVDRSSTAK